MKEIWKRIGESRYEVSNKGEVRNRDTGKILSQYLNGKGGYKLVAIGERSKKNNKKKSLTLVHRLVASSFIDNPNGFPYVNHKDENRINNCVENLEWCTPRYNSNYGTTIEKRRKNALNMSDEWKKNLSEAAKRKFKRMRENGESFFTWKNVEITHRDTGEKKIFASSKEAARFLGVNPSKFYYAKKKGYFIEDYKIRELKKNVLKTRRDKKNDL